MTFVYYLALGYLAAGLLASGIHHAAGWTSFREIVRSHRIVPVGLATPLAILITVVELVAGSAALGVLFSDKVAARAPVLFSVCTVLGIAFALYVRRLLRNPTGITSCGCSSFAAPLTIASIIPALALAVVSLSGLAAAALGFGNTLNQSFVTGLPLVWGVTLALLVNLLPASMPRQLA